MRKTTPEEKFQKFVEKTSTCWLWRGHCLPNGYGQINYGGHPHKAHRISWILRNGPISRGMQVLHKCDVRNCVRPDHLFLGTHKDNMRDMAIKGRAATGDRHVSKLYPGIQRGAKNGNAKLTEEEIAKIRTLYAQGGVSQEALGRVYGVNQTHVSKIVRRLNWRDA